jgi:hypothetical protein
VPVRAIFLLTQAAADEAIALPVARAFAELHVRTVHPTVSPREVAAVVATIERIARTVPVAELRFRPTPEAFRVAKRFAEEAGGRR